MAVYVLGKAAGTSLEEVGLRAIEQADLRLQDDGNVGRCVRFKAEEEGVSGEFTIVACQLVWGYDESGKYTIVNGYRVTGKDHRFGLPCYAAEIEFVEPTQ